MPGASRQRLADEAPSGHDAAVDEHKGAWHRAGLRRRIVLLALVIVQTIVATEFMSAVLPYHGGKPLETLLLLLFAILFGWVSAGFWTAMAGFFLLLVGRDRYAISRTAAEDAPIAEEARTAIVMPICNEDVTRVFAGLRATYRSVAMTGELAHFDFFLLSDSNNPETRVAEVAAWLELCRAVDGFGRIFYRWRQHRIKRKSGNVADFCRRWGKNYRYMVVLDADSVMSGGVPHRAGAHRWRRTRGRHHPDRARAAGRETLYARIQQFATCVYGPLFTAGLHFWQLGESHYWGHNAIIRVAPFIRHCGLGRLPGRGSLSGEILSHDFVEAALMRRAGWAVWIAYDLSGSYEEMPPNLIDELKRDRRWCQGNLMNFRLFLMKGLHPAHRAVFMTGVMALPLGTPVVRVSHRIDLAARGAHAEASHLFPRTLSAFSGMAGVASGMGDRALQRDRHAPVPAEDFRHVAAGCQGHAPLRRRRAPRGKHGRRNDHVGNARADPHAVPHPLRVDSAAGVGGELEVSVARGCCDYMDRGFRATWNADGHWHPLGHRHLLAQSCISVVAAPHRWGTDSLDPTLGVYEPHHTRPELSQGAALPDSRRILATARNQVDRQISADAPFRRRTLSKPWSTPLSMQ